jgi:hypothetical protein
MSLDLTDLSTPRTRHLKRSGALDVAVGQRDHRVALVELLVPNDQLDRPSLL